MTVDRIDPETPREQMLAILRKTLSPEDAERAMDRVVMRLGGATHEEALRAHPRLEPRRDRDGQIR